MTENILYFSVYLASLKTAKLQLSLTQIFLFRRGVSCLLIACLSKCNWVFLKVSGIFKIYAFSFFDFCPCYMIEIVIKETLQQRNNFIHLLLCQTLPHILIQILLMKNTSAHPHRFSLAHTFKWRQILVGRQKRETAKLPFIFLNIALRSPKSLSFTAKIRFLLLSSPNIFPSSPEDGQLECLL